MKNKKIRLCTACADCQKQLCSVKSIKQCTDYNQSNAFTSAVNKKGRGTQNHSGQTTKNPIVTNKETKKYTQYAFVLVAADMMHLLISWQRYVIIY